MNTLLASYALLANAILDDPLLSLANAVVWLDPLWQMSDDYEYEEGGDAEFAMHVTRSVFPEIYAGAVEQIRTGMTYAQLDNYVCREVSKIGIPLDSLEYLAYGIPLPAHGVELYEPDTYKNQPELARILALFCVQPEPNEWRVEVPDDAYTTGRLLADSLVKQEDERWKQVGWALAWLFSCTGNSLIDCDDESLAEFAPMPWDEENVAFALEMLEEAEGVLKDVDAGLTFLDTYPDAFRIFSDNLNHVQQRLAKGKVKNRESHIRLEWPPLGGGADGATVIGTELLQLRGDAVEA